MSGITAVVRAWTVPAQGTGKVVQFIVTNGEVNFFQHSKRLGFAGLVAVWIGVEHRCRNVRSTPMMIILSY